MNQTSMQAVKTDSRFDVLKFAMAMMIVALHTMLWPDVLLPWLRIAVPVFFIISSYFFFKKVNKATSSREARSYLLVFVKRSAILYLFWFVVLLIPTIIMRRWFDYGFLPGVAKMVLGILFDSSFVASWFITANIIGTCVIFYFRRFKIVGFILGLALYLVCCASSSYYGAFPGFNSWLTEAFPGYCFYSSFPAAILWIWMGEMASRISNTGKWKLWLVVTVIGAVMLFLEYRMVMSHNWVRDNDSLVSLIILCPAVFMLTKSLPATYFANSIILRKSSIIFYCVHGTMARMILYYFRTKGEDSDWVGVFTFCVTTAVCVFATWLLLTLAQRRGWKWLKYAY